MAYTVARVRLGAFRDPFKDTEDDLNFKASTYPDLDEYLTTMEQRGWTVVNIAPMEATSALLITMHRLEP